MSISAAAIALAILRLLPVPNPEWGETQADYRARVDIIAEAIAVATHGSRALAMAVVVKFDGESKFSPFVQAGIERGHNGAICLGQHERLKRSLVEWYGLAGLSLKATTRCAYATADALRKSLAYCRARDPGAGYPEAMVAYGTGRTCNADESRRADLFRERAEKWSMLMGAKS
jgi:hypothetical protein